MRRRLVRPTGPLAEVERLREDVLHWTGVAAEHYKEFYNEHQEHAATMALLADLRGRIEALCAEDEDGGLVLTSSLRAVLAKYSGRGEG